MKCTIPEISWHNRDPVLSIDIQAINNEEFYRLASGGTDSHVLIWHLKILDTGATSVEAVSDLTRHQRAVNVVRWSPSGQYLASGDDDANIIIWQQKADDLAVMLDGDNNDKEKWSVFKVLRGHKEDVYDICWSPDSLKLVSGSVDNTAIIWDLTKGINDNILKDHKGFVQGVSWDPVGQYIATLSSDRICRVFNDTGKHVKARVSKGSLSVPASHPLHGQVVRYYHDDTLKSFFRRLTFSPDGNLIITPAGYLEMGPNSKNLYTTYIYTTSSLTQPAVVLPSPGQYTIAVRCCPILFELWPNGPEPVITLPYRMVIAVATRSSVILYDTQQTTPFAIISNIHYTRLTDVTWSHDGRLLAVSSTDGFCSLVTFERNELGKEYVKEEEIVEEEQPSVELNETNEEIIDTSLNMSVEVEPKEKKPNFLEQWASKSAKKVENESKKTVVNNDDVIIIEPENEKENVINLVQEKETILKKEESKVDSSKSSFKSEVTKSENTSKQEEPKPVTTPNKNSSIKSQKKSSTPAKPIAVRRKPRSDQMNITQFLKSPKACSSKTKTTTETGKTVITPVVVIAEDSVARDAWMCEDKLETKEVKTGESSSQNTDVIPVENTQDIKLVLEESTMQNIKENTIAKGASKSEEKMDLDQEPECQVIESDVKEKQDKQKMDVDCENVKNGETSTSDNNVGPICVEKNPPSSKLNKSASSNEKPDSKTDKNNEQKIAIPALIMNKNPQKKRIPLITLSSPKHKKKPL